MSDTLPQHGTKSVKVIVNTTSLTMRREYPRICSLAKQVRLDPLVWKSVVGCQAGRDASMLESSTACSGREGRCRKVSKDAILLSSPSLSMRCDAIKEWRL